MLNQGKTGKTQRKSHCNKFLSVCTVQYSNEKNDLFEQNEQFHTFFNVIKILPI